jgi:hypothetical protein
MTTLNASQANALRLIVSATVDAVKAAGPSGAPAGVLYAAMMGHGCKLSQFESLMGALVRQGILTHDADSHTYRAA